MEEDDQAWCFLVFCLTLILTSLTTSCGLFHSCMGRLSLGLPRLVDAENAVCTSAVWCSGQCW